MLAGAKPIMPAPPKVWLFEPNAELLLEPFEPVVPVTPGAPVVPDVPAAGLVPVAVEVPVL